MSIVNNRRDRKFVLIVTENRLVQTARRNNVMVLSGKSSAGNQNYVTNGLKITLYSASIY